MLITALTAAMLMPAPPQIRPSFNCSRASTRTERLICSDAYLASLDRQMAQAYARLQTQIPTEDLRPLRADQRQWLRDRDACISVECLIVTYQERIDRLGGY